MSNKVVHFEVLGKDGKKLQDFFSGLFGWKIDDSNPMKYGLVDAAQAGLGGGIATDQPGGTGHLTFYVEVDDLQATLSKAESLGGKTVAPPMKIPDGPEIALFADPEGHIVGLSKAGTM